MFKTFEYENHNETCYEKQGLFLKIPPRQLCKLELEKELIQVDGNFILLIFPKCITDNRYFFIGNFIQEKIKNKLKKNIIAYDYSVTNVFMNKDLKKWRSRNINLCKSTPQIHFISMSYIFNTTDYLFSEISFIGNDADCWNEYLKNSYKEAKKSFIKNENYSFLPKLKSLYKKNIIK